MKYIGVTGGVGCGKSEVLRFLEEEYDCEVLRSDELARELMLRGGSCFEPVLALFGEEVLGEDGEFDRQAIAQKVFADPLLLEKLNQITHPAVREEIERRVEAARKRGRKFFFLEAALLIEEKYDEICNELWYVYAEESVRRKRLAQSRGYSEEKISQVMANQLSEDVFRKHCSFVVDNSGTMEHTREQIRSYMRSAFEKGIITE